MAALRGALLLTVLAGLALAGFLLLRAGRAPAARPLAAFVLMVGAWAGSLVLSSPTGVLATTPFGAAGFLHFVSRLSGRGRGWGPWGYGAAVLAAGMPLALGDGVVFAPAGLGDAGLRYAGAGWLAPAAALGLAALGHGLLYQAWRAAEGLRRRQLATVAASSLLGLGAVSGLAPGQLGWPLPPWTLLALPAYPAGLVFGILRYELLEVPLWSRRAAAWVLLMGLSLLPAALLAALPAEMVWASGSFGERWGAVAAVTVPVALLSGPLRRLADRLVYPRAEISAADLAVWRAELAGAPDEGQLAELARRRLTVLLRLPALAIGLELRPGAVAVRGCDAAPPEIRRLAAVYADLLAQALADLHRRRAAAERERLAELGALAASVAHDLRNPLNIIAMAVAEADADLRCEVRTQLARMEALVRDLLDYAKPWGLRPETVDLAAALAQAGQGMAFSTDIPEGLLLRADPLRLHQALSNLLANARTAGGRVLVAAEREEEALLVHVCDDGPGIPEDIRPVLFQPFVSRGAEGTGLGLAIVAKVMAAHGGVATLGHRPGWTTCFTLRFPL